MPRHQDSKSDQKLWLKERKIFVERQSNGHRRFIAQKSSLSATIPQSFGLFDQGPQINLHCFSDTQQRIECRPAQFMFHAADHRVRHAGTLGDGVHRKSSGDPLLSEQADHRRTDLVRR